MRTGLCWVAVWLAGYQHALENYELAVLDLFLAFVIVGLVWMEEES